EPGFGYLRRRREQPCPAANDLRRCPGTVQHSREVPAGPGPGRRAVLLRARLPPVRADRHLPPDRQPAHRIPGTAHAPGAPGVRADERRINEATTPPCT